MNKMEKLRALGMNTEEGLACCADEEEFYLEMIEEFVREGEQRSKDLALRYAEQDWKNYVIPVHSLKSTSRMIGADALSEQARELEFFAREEKSGQISSLHGEMMKNYETLCATLKEILES